MDERQSWLLLFLGAEGGPHGCDQIRVMKGVFLLSQVEGHPAQQLYYFEPYDYGPFDARIYRDLDALQLSGLVSVQRWAGSTRKTYELTEDGWTRFAQLRERVPDDQYAAVQRAKVLVTSLGFDALLKRIYDASPDYAERSIARVASQPA